MAVSLENVAGGREHLVAALCRFIVVAQLAVGISLTLTAAAQPPRREPGLPIWSLSTAPLLSLGGDGAPATEFLRVRGTFRLRNGLIAVVNSANNEIRIFDERGKALRFFGRSGSGPGEFRSISWVGRSADTAFVFDAALRRITTILLGREPKLLGSIAVAARGERGPFGAVGRLADGQWLVTTYVSPRFDGPPGVNRVPGSVGLIAADGSGDVRWLGEIPSMAIVVYNPTGNIMLAVVGPIAFSPHVQAAAVGAFAWFGESGSDSLVRFDPRDGKRAKLRLPFTSTPPRSSLVAAARARELATARDPRARAWAEAKHSAAYLPRTLPFFESLVAGPGGELWIQVYAGVPTDTARYLVVGSDLKPRAWVNVPRGFRVREVGADYALGVHEDDDGVESVRMYRLTRR